MSSFTKTALFVSSVLVLSLAVLPVSAKLDSEIDGGQFGIQSGANLKGTLVNVINVFLSLVSVIAAAAIIYGGVRYMLSQGDEQEATKAKHIVLYALIGLIIVGLAAVIVNFTLGAVSGSSGGGGGNNGGGN